MKSQDPPPGSPAPPTLAEEETPIIPAANLEANLAAYPAANLAAQEASWGAVCKLQAARWATSLSQSALWAAKAAKAAEREALYAALAAAIS